MDGVRLSPAAAAAAAAAAAPRSHIVCTRMEEEEQSAPAAVEGSLEQKNVFHIRFRNHFKALKWIEKNIS